MKTLLRPLKTAIISGKEKQIKEERHFVSFKIIIQAYITADSRVVVLFFIDVQSLTDNKK